MKESEYNVGTIKERYATLDDISDLLKQLNTKIGDLMKEKEAASQEIKRLRKEPPYDN